VQGFLALAQSLMHVLSIDTTASQHSKRTPLMVDGAGNHLAANMEASTVASSSQQ